MIVLTIGMERLRRLVTPANRGTKVFAIGVIEVNSGEKLPMLIRLSVGRMMVVSW